MRDDRLESRLLTRPQGGAPATRRGRIAGTADRDKTTGNEGVATITGVTETTGEASAFASSHQQ
jgi:hypothetical protein